MLYDRWMRASGEDITRKRNRHCLRVTARLFVVLLMFCAAGSDAAAQLFEGRPAAFTRADSLRGGLRPERTCYDVKFYRLNVRIDPDSQAIGGSNRMEFLVLEKTHLLQVDLFRNMEIDGVTLDDETGCDYRRDENAVFIATPRTLRPGELHSLLIVYHGKPRIARVPPWEGGFIWTKDSTGGPWVAVACQGTGASLWWPNKDHPADEPDSMAISVTVPPGLEDVSNGRLRSKRVHADGWTTFDWFVSSPINNYDVTVNVGKFSHFSDVYASGDTVTLDYYVLPQNLQKARRQFLQVKDMLRAYQHYFGPYPFPRDGYKLVESPHLGMEHQGCIAYGNGFLQGYRGRSSSAPGVMFDFIIVHESAHEWWGNSVTAADIADMWIHESFGAYAEALFVEYWHGRDSSLQYINGKRPNLWNKAPMQGPYGVNKEGSGDMYDKGQLVLNTLRSVIGNDSLWFSILRGIQEEFRWKTTSYDALVASITRRAGMNLGAFFDQYFRHAALPRLVATITRRGEETNLRFRWDAEVPEFAMPVIVHPAPGRSLTLSPVSSWTTLKLEDGADPAAFSVDNTHYLFDATITRQYIDPHEADPRL